MHIYPILADEVILVTECLNSISSTCSRAVTNENKCATEIKWIVFYLKDESIIWNPILTVALPLTEYKNYCYWCCYMYYSSTHGFLLQNL